MTARNNGDAEMNRVRGTNSWNGTQIEIQIAYDINYNNKIS